MRILYVDVNTTHINPTANLFPLMLLEISNDVTFYGPGYVENKQIDAGILNFLKLKNTFDIVIFGPTCPIMSQNGEEEIVYYCKKYTANDLCPKTILRFYKDINKNFVNLEINIKAISILNYDYYSDPGKILEVIDKNSIYLIGPNEQSMSLLNELPSFAKEEKHYKRKLGSFSDRWFEYVTANPDRHITALHFVSFDEFFFEPLNSRKYQISVPGVEYFLRKKAVKKLEKSNFKMAPKIIFHLYRALNFFKIYPHSNRYGMNFYNSSFKNILRNTKCVYTARGGFGIPVRKFFEIPASGSLLICNPCIGFRELGFVPNKHYIKSNPDDLPDVLNYWMQNPEAQNIALSGQSLVLSKHSLKSRSQQIQACMLEIIKNNFLSARWKDGEYIINKKVKS